MGLCEECEAFDMQKLGRGPCGYHYEETLQRAQGCDFCRTLTEHEEVKELVRRHRLPAEAWFHFEVFSDSNDGEGKNGIGANRLRVTLAPRYFVQLSQFESGEFLTIDFFLQADRGTPPAENHDVLGQFPGNDPLSQGHCTAVRHWLHECVQSVNHARCNQTISGHRVDLNAWEAPLPSRCVEVLGPDRVRLCVNDNTKGPYITLSHRWEGDTKGCSTTTKNYDARLVDIPISKLTKTFQDAILIAHLTGIPYLWIDSVCIIQEGDEKQDWRRESMKMAEYYQNSIFTLTAIREPGQVGILPSRAQLGDRSLVQLPYRDQRGNRRGYVYLYLIDHNLRTSYRKLIQDDELLGRGWVFQEQMLSRRLLYYTKAGVIFECRTGNPQNTLGDRWTKSSEQGDDFGAIFRWIKRAQEDGEEPSRLISVLVRKKFDLAQRSFDTWCKLVEEYSSRELTYWSDRLPALSGITAEYRRYMQLWDIPPYLSGLWTGDIYFGLLWAQKGEPTPIARIEEIASWSWASLPAEISWNHLYLHRKRLVPACKVINVAETNGMEVEEWSLSSKKDKIPATTNSETTTSAPPEFPLNRVINQLKIQGKHQTVIIREQCPSEDNSSFIFWERCQSFGHDSLRRFVYSPSRPDLVAGWASFEHPGYGSITHTSEETGLNLVSTFLIMTEKRAEWFGLSLGHWLPWNDLHYVIFLRRLGDNLYQRAGVGVLFGKDVEREFHLADESEILLV